MPVVPLHCRWLVLLAYPAVGLVLGLADPALGQVAHQLGTKPGAATAVSVNLLLPAAAVVLALAHARLGSVWLGALLMTCGLGAGLAIQYHAGPVAPADIPPVLVVAAFGYGVLGTAAALARTRCRPA
jgi:hypothetical protein